MSTILVPVDFSEYSEYALEVAASIAEQTNSGIVLVHMMGLADTMLNKEESDDVINKLQYMEIVKRRFQDFKNRDFLKNIQVKDTVVNYREFNEMDDIADAWSAFMIVMGSHGATGFRDAFVGSNAEKVIRSSSIPVLVVKERIREFTISNAVFATDFKDESIPAYREARKFLKNFNCEPKLLYVNIPERFMSTRELEASSAEFLDKAEVDNPDIYENVEFYDDYTFEGGIYHYSKEKDADIIMIPTHGRKGIAHFFYGSASENISNTCKLPVMTFKIHRP